MKPINKLCRIKPFYTSQTLIDVCQYKNNELYYGISQLKLPFICVILKEIIAYSEFYYKVLYKNKIIYLPSFIMRYEVIEE